MAATQEMSIVIEVIKEVESYLPEMSAFLHALAIDSADQEETEKELHRMTHTIKGAAAMVQLEELSKTAALMEDVLDDILEGKQSWNEQYVEAMCETINHIASYCTSLHNGSPDGAELYRKAFEAFEKTENTFSLPPDVNTDLIQQDDEKDLLVLLGENVGDESDDDFFKQFSNKEEHVGVEDELAFLLESVASESGDDSVDALLGTESNNSTEFVLDEATKESFSSLVSSIDQELQESFDEEAEEHLDNISRQLNELFASINEQTAVSVEVRDRLHSIRRSVHTLKGAAAVIGIEPVADWGHDFEDFLDIIHDESDTISPASITVMQDGADILEKIVNNPGVDVSVEIGILQDIFPSIMADAPSTGEGIPEESVPHAVKKAIEAESVPESDIPVATDEQISKKPALQDTIAKDRWAQPTAIDDLAREHIFHARKEGGADRCAKIRITGSNNKLKKTEKRTLRVGSEKIAELMNLSGDMAINLSSFENSVSSMQSSLDEFDVTLQHLKGIVSSLEAGYRQTSISNPGVPAGISQSQQKVTDEFDPLEMDHYSELYILLNSLNEAVVELDSVRSQTSGVQHSWRHAVDRQRRTVREVQSAVQSVQMTPFSTISNRLYKTVRESARVTDKNVRLLIEGGSTEMDTHIWNVLADALMHMLRNSVDHGVDSVEERLLAGKPEQATIRINCSRQGSHCVLRLSDDGGGLNYDAIRKRALMLYPETDVEQMDSKGLAALIFKQGFSIRSKATSLSGRGVGMDVVRNALDQLNGFVEVYSNTGQGTDFVLSIPIAVAQLPVLMVMFGTQQFAVPMRDINSVFRLSAEEIQKATFEVNDESFPLVRPAELMLLQCSADSAVDGNDVRDSSLALAVETFGRRGVLVADAIIGQKHVVFKNLGSHLQNIPYVAGVTILGDGRLVPILKTEDLFERAKSVVQRNDTVTSEKYEEEKILEVLIVDDSISIRKVLSNFVTAQGWQPTTAHDGVEAMEKIRKSKPELIILDIEMPRMNGFEVLQALQAQPAYRAIPVLMLSSRSAGKYGKKAAGLGARGFITKPFKDDELLSLISSLTT